MRNSTDKVGKSSARKTSLFNYKVPESCQNLLFLRMIKYEAVVFFLILATVLVGEVLYLSQVYLGNTDSTFCLSRDPHSRSNNNMVSLVNEKLFPDRISSISQSLFLSQMLTSSSFSSNHARRRSHLHFPPQ